MKLINTPIKDLYVIEPKVIKDYRGFFYESYNKLKFDALIGKEVNFVQDNHSLSAFGTIRGLHFQYDPQPQAKLVRCFRGAILDVAVDIRPNSETYGKHFSIILNSDNNFQLWIPEGFAHGFQVLSSIAEVNYKVTNYWSKEHEGNLKYNDPILNVNWSDIPLVISEKDENAINFNDIYL